MKINLGCGDDIRRDCVNVDVRALPGMLQADARDLPFFDGEADEVLANDVIEHFTVGDAKIVIGEIWRVLRVGGVVEFRLPSLEGIVDAYRDGESAEKVSWWLFGGQDYEENYHFAVYDAKSFTKMLKGFEVISIEFLGSNMVVKAKKLLRKD